MKWILTLSLFVTVACETTREKNALILKDRVDKLSSLSTFKPLRCQVKTELSAPQKQRYEAAFPDEKELAENWDVTFEWTARHSRCEVKPKPLTPMTANQRVFVEEAFCTLMQVFWVHSPFDDLKVLPTDVEDADTQIFLRQKEDSDVGLYLNKNDMSMETRTLHKGTLSARYSLVGTHWLPSELKHETHEFNFALRDFEWNELESRSPPQGFWIFAGDTGTPPSAHTQVQITDCQPY